MNHRKQTSTIQAKIAEVQKKDKRYNYVILLIILLLTGFLATLVIYSQEKRNQTNEAIIADLVMEKKENERLITAMETREDSIEDLVKTLRHELEKIQEDVDNSSMKYELQANIDIAQEKLNRISNNINDNTIIRYYKRKADGDKIERLIERMENPGFSLNLKQVANDDGRHQVNTIWYGSDVNENEVYELHQALKKINIKINDIRLFEEKSGYEWKSAAIELGYEPEKSSEKSLTKEEVAALRVNNNNIKYNVRFYAYNPNPKIKKALTTLIRKENYNLKIYPDWEEKQSFFANHPTVFYYSNETKDIAEKLAATLSQSQRGVTFQTKLGNGYGISSAEKKNTFIVHYTQ